MKPTESLSRLINLFDANGIAPEASTPRQGIDTMFAFYETTPCEECRSDLLLFQWGTYDCGDGKFFELNITRQFSEIVPEYDDDEADDYDDAEDDSTISQLSLTYKFTPSAGFDRVGSGNCWSDGPQPFREFVRTSQAFMAIADKLADAVALTHYYV